MEGEVCELVGAELGVRRRDDQARTATGICRGGGGRDRVADLQDPAGQLLPELLGAAPASDQALLAVVQQA
jgi:hypothetical protein